jgi:hypothetical protein
LAACHRLFESLTESSDLGWGRVKIAALPRDLAIKPLVESRRVESGESLIFNQRATGMLLNFVCK